MKNNENTAPKRWLWLTEIYLQKLSKKSEVDSWVEFLGSLGSRTEIQRCAVWLRQKSTRCMWYSLRVLVFSPTNLEELFPEYLLLMPTSL